MRNVWKGMVIGALTGAATGLVVDIGERGAEGAAGIGTAVVEHVPEVAGQVRQVVSGAASSAFDHGTSSDVSKKARAATKAAQDQLSTVLSEGIDQASDAVDVGKDLVESVRGKKRG